MSDDSVDGADNGANNWDAICSAAKGLGPVIAELSEVEGVVAGRLSDTLLAIVFAVQTRDVQHLELVHGAAVLEVSRA